MLKLKLNKGDCSCELEGKTSTILSELTIGCAHVLHTVLEDEPEGLRTECTQSFIDGLIFAINYMEGAEQ